MYYTEHKKVLKVYIKLKSLPTNSVFEMKLFQVYFHECIFAFVFISNSLIF